jgi:hypothetical protein
MRPVNPETIAHSKRRGDRQGEAPDLLDADEIDRRIERRNARTLTDLAEDLDRRAADWLVDEGEAA